MTNLSYKGFREPKLVFVCDPKGEREAIAESAKNGVPLVALCDSDNDTTFIDMVVPANNKGKKSLALIFYVLTREIMMAQNKIASYDEFKYDPIYFEQMIMEEKKPEAESAEAAQQPAEVKTEAKVEAPKAAPAPEKKA
jgi:small subunit ribosomal protein S2